MRCEITHSSIANHDLSLCVTHRVGIELPVAVTSTSDRIRRHHSFTRPLTEVPLNGNFVALQWVHCVLCVWHRVVWRSKCREPLRASWAGPNGVERNHCSLLCNGMDWVSPLQCYPNPRQRKVLRCVCVRLYVHTTYTFLSVLCVRL